MNVRTNWYYILIIFVLVDIGYSFCQYYHTSLDGDLPNIILPSERYQPLMNDPLAISVVIENENYASPNRFFAHWLTSTYFRNVPLFLQKITNPIDSVYLSCATIKTLTHIILLYLLTIFITGIAKFRNPKFWIAAALISPLFHTSGYYHYIGIIDKATTYTLFYALPLGLLMIFFLPFYQRLFLKSEKRLGKFQLLFYFLLSFYLSLNGPLIPALVLLFVMFLMIFILFKFIKKTKTKSFQNFLLEIEISLGKERIFLISAFSLFSLYSFFVGMNNIEGDGYSISLVERYMKIPEGIFNMLTQKLGFPILIGMILLNIFLIKKQAKSVEGEKLIRFFKWLFVFAVVYILLLPMGGFREYRPNIIRRDTFLPITLSIFYVYGISSFYLLSNLLPKYKPMYIGLLILIGLNFTAVDLPDFKHNECEKEALHRISRAESEVVKIDNDCLVMTWVKVEDPEFTKTNSEVLLLWNIIEKPKLYYQE